VELACYHCKLYAACHKRVEQWSRAVLFGIEKFDDDQNNPLCYG
jgi:hypothetical protein